MKLLIQPGKLFKGWTGQPLDRRFKASLKNAILNLVEKRRNRSRLIPSVPIANEFEPGTAADHQRTRLTTDYSFSIGDLDCSPTTARV